jgi:RNA polymerase sigma-70 factor (ECF subfamily)
MDSTLCVNSTDDELLVAVARGDRNAFSELYDRFAPHVLARVKNQIDDGGLAEEMVLDVFLEFWRQAPRLERSLGRAASWLLTTPLVNYVRPGTTALG